MPMIDVYAPGDLLPTGSDRRIGEELTRAVLRAEGVSAPGPFHLENTAAFIHRMDPATVQTAAEARRTSNPRADHHAARRVDEKRPEAAREGRDRNHGGHLRRPDASKRTWVLLTEAAEGGWGIAGTAFGREEFAALAAAGAAAKK